MPILMHTFHVDLTTAGLLMSIFAVTGFILAIPAGFIFQILGAQATGLIALGCLDMGATVGALSSTTGMLLGSRVIEGLGMGLIAVAAPAVIAMWFPAERRGTPMGIWAAWVPVGSVLMFILAPALNMNYGWRSVWWFGAGFALVAFILYLLLVRMPSEVSDETAAAAPSNPSRALANSNIWLLGLAFGCFNVVMLALTSFLPTFLVTERGYTLVMASFTTSLIMMLNIGSSPLGGWLSDWIGSRKRLIIIPFVMITLLLPFPFIISSPLIPVFMILLGLVSGVIPTAIFAGVPEVMSRPNLIGIGMAVVILGQNLGMFIGPVFYGRMVELFNWETAGYLLIPVAIVGIVAARLVKVR